MKSKLDALNNFKNRSLLAYIVSQCFAPIYQLTMNHITLPIFTHYIVLITRITLVYLEPKETFINNRFPNYVIDIQIHLILNLFNFMSYLLFIFDKYFFIKCISVAFATTTKNCYYHNYSADQKQIIISQLDVNFHPFCLPEKVLMS